MADISEQEKMDQLLAELQDEVGGNAGGDAGDLTDQEKMDRLIAELQSQAGQDDDDAEAEESEQEKMDRLIADLGSEDEADVDDSAAGAEAPPDADESDGGTSLNQDDLDALLAQIQQDEAAEAASEGGDVDADEAVATEDAEETEAVGDAEETETAEDAEEAVAVDDPAVSAGAPDAVETDFLGLDDDEADLDGYENEAPGDAVPEDDLPKITEAEAENDVSDEDASGDAPDSPAMDPPFTDSQGSAADFAEEDDADVGSSRQRRARALKEKRKRPRAILAALLGILVVCAVAILGAIGYHLYRGWYRPAPAATAAPSPATTPARPPATHVTPPPKTPVSPPSAPAPPATVTAPASEPVVASPPLASSPAGIPETGTISQGGATEPSPADTVNYRLQTIDRIRQGLLAKREEIVTLKKRYEAGIGRVEDEMRARIAKNKVRTFQEARKIDGIVYDLRTIRRRQIIIGQLTGPLNRLEKSSEALLYARRRAEIDLLLVNQVLGVGIDGIRQTLDDEIARYRIDVDNLLPAPPPPSNDRLEAVWKSAFRNLSTRADDSLAARTRAAVSAAEQTLSNQVIWKQMENGDFENIYRLTALSEKAAQALATWKGKELFLNRLTDLSPEAAWQLSRWKGDWLGLNGLTDMSGDTANALARWPGQRLSLNGFKELPVQAARYLSMWQGKEIELMGLDRLSSVDAQYLSQWRRPGRRLYVPDRFWRPRTAGPAGASGAGSATHSS